MLGSSATRQCPRHGTAIPRDGTQPCCLAKFWGIPHSRNFVRLRGPERRDQPPPKGTFEASWEEDRAEVEEFWCMKQEREVRNWGLGSKNRG